MNRGEALERLKVLYEHLQALKAWLENYQIRNSANYGALKKLDLTKKDDLSRVPKLIRENNELEEEFGVFKEETDTTLDEIKELLNFLRGDGGEE